MGNYLDIARRFIAKREAEQPVTTEPRHEAMAERAERSALETERCPTCGGELRVSENERCRYIECASEPVHFFRLTNKRPGKPMGYFLSYQRDAICQDCGQRSETYGDWCAKCLRDIVANPKLFEM